MCAHEPTDTQQAKLDAICLEFEQAWRAGERPRIESYLDGFNDSERAQLLPELLLLELEHLQRSQTVPNVDDYLTRFPDDHTLVRLVLRAFEGGPEATVDHAPIAEHVGSEIGRYKLLEQIGEGGMGVVYMAEQQRPVRRKVALKIIKPGMDSKQVVARFEVERQALAMMEHPNIARAFDAGTTDSGLPYFVMELVRGVPITQFCDEKKLDTNERLKLFALICRAVQHAHTKGIIHRDMKPTNVLVTLHDGVPVPKIIDFGVAKATGQQLTDRTLFTAFAQIVGTPLYMSPEQAELSGLDIDTRSDIYSLGVLLYELLTGTTPFDRKRLQSAAYDEVRRIIREEEPEKPSTRVSTMDEANATASRQRSTDPARLKHTLRGELDWIVMKALEKDRNRRYETASALATEVTRYLSGEPVAAGPPSTTYRLRKFAGRHRKQVTVAGGFLALVLISSILSWFLYVDASQARDDALAAGVELKDERDIAKRERDRAESAESSARLHADELKQRVYDANMIQAQAAYKRDDETQTLTFLEDCLTPQRSWEWHRLNHLVRHDIAGEYVLPNEPVGLVISPAGSLMAIADREGVLYILDTRSGDTLWTESGTHKFFSDVKFSTNGKLIAVVRRNKQQLLTLKDINGTLQTELYVCEAMTGKRVWHEKGNNDQFLFVGFSPGNRRLAVSLGKNHPRYGVQLRNVDDGALIWSAPTDNPASDCIEFSPDGHRLFMLLQSGVYLARPSQLVCWNADNHEEIWAVDRDVSSRIALSPDGAWLATGGKNHSVQIWDAATGKEVAELKGEFTLLPRKDVGQYAFVGEVRFSHDGSTLGARGGLGMTLWDWPSRRPKRSIYHPRTRVDDGMRIHFSANDKHLVLRDFRLKGNVVFRDIDPPRTEIPLVGHESTVRGVDFSKDGGQLASIGQDGTVRYWNASTGQEVRTTIVTPTDGYSAAHSPAGDYVATAADDGVKLWETRSGVLKHHWPQIGKAIHVTFSDDGQRVAASGDSLCVWNVGDGRQLLANETPQDVYGVAFCRDHQRLVTVDRLASIQLVDLANHVPTEIRRADPFDADEDVRCLVRDPTSNIIAVGIKNRIELWDPDAEVRPLMPLKTLVNDDAVRCLLFNQDGTRLFSGDSEGMVRVWKVETGARLLNWSAEQGIVFSLALSPDGKTLATAGENGTVKLWETTRAADDVLAQRRIVDQATRIVNERYSQSTSLRDVLESLTSDASIDDQVLPTAIEIANARGNRPVQSRRSMPDPDRRDVQANVRKNFEEVQRGLVDLIEDAAGFELEEAADAWRQSRAPAQWYSAANRLTAPGTAPLPPAELSSMLSILIDSHPHVHQFVYVRGLLHARYGRWADADADFSNALQALPEESLLWHEYAYRLAFLLGHTGQTERYRELCQQTLKNFGDTQEIQLAERTAKMCLFLPAGSGVVEQAGALADRAIAGAADSPDWLRPFLSLCHGIAEYRRGDFAAAAEHLEHANSVKTGFDSPHPEVTRLFLSMAYQQLGRQEEAQRMLQDLQAELNRIDSLLADPRGKLPNWSDWMIVHLVRPEAEALIFAE